MSIFNQLSPVEWKCKTCSRVYMFDEEPEKCEGCEYDTKISKGLKSILDAIDEEFQNLDKNGSSLAQLIRLMDYYSVSLAAHEISIAKNSIPEKIRKLIEEYESIYAEAMSQTAKNFEVGL